MEKRWKRWALAGAGAVLLAAVLAAGWLLTKPRGAALYESVTIQAEQQGAHGVDVGSAFAVSLGYAARGEKLSEMLETEPALSYRLTGGGRSWTLKPAEPLERNRVYTFRVKNPAGEVVRSFAFQTESDLLVQSVYPRDNRRYAPQDTGIEITFNAADVDPTGFASIRPETAGSWVMRGNTAVFQPAAPLEQDSIYRVTLKAGLQAANGMALAEDYAFSFETEESDPKGSARALRLSGAFSESFLPGDPVVVAMYGDELDGVPFTTSVHRLTGAEAYVRALTQYDAHYRERVGRKQEYRMDPAGLELVTQAAGELVYPDPNRDECYAVVPEELAPGYYLVSVEGGGGERLQKLVQVSDLAVYTQSVDGETLVWVNNASTGEPEAGVRVDMQDSANTAEKRGGVTGADGLVRLDTGALEQGLLTLSGAGKPLYVDRVDLSIRTERDLSERFFSALYSDRELYQPTDTLRFWGVIRPRLGEAEAPGWVDAVLWGPDNAALAKARIPLGRDGTYSGTLELDGIAQGWYTVAITDGSEDGAYQTHGVRVSEFQKPAFLIDTKPEKSWYYADEPVTLLVEAAYFDGQAVTDGRLRLDSYTLETQRQAEQGVDPVITLDRQGKGRYTGTPGSDVSGQSCFPTSAWYNLSNADPEDVAVNASGRFTVAYSKNLIDVKDDGETLTIRTARLNEARVGEDDWEARRRPDGSYIDLFEWYADAPADLPLTVEVRRMRTRRVPVSQYYDEISRRMVTKYETEREEALVETIRTGTAGGVVTLPLDPVYMGGGTDWYWLVISYENGMGGTMQESYYFGRGGYSQSGLSRYAFSGGSSQYGSAALGEPVRLGLYNRGEEAKNEGRVLYTVLQKGMVESGFYSGDSFDLPFTEQHVPNIAVYGAYFDGRHIYSIEPYRCVFNTEEKTLQVTVEAEQSILPPGGEAEVRVTLTDAEGKPAEGEVCVGVVDEAVFALVPQELDVAGQLYTAVFWAQVSESASYQEYSMKPDLATGGMGGGGGEEAEARSDFVDTALFQTVTVDDSGEASVKLRLPDNITNWRLTAAAVTADLKAGTGTGSVVATLPFYLRPLVSSAYLEGDDVTVSARSVCGPEAGRADLTAELLDESGSPLQSLSGQADPGESAAFRFGKLAQGSYTVRFAGGGGAGKDVVEQRFEVIPAGLAVPVESEVALEEVAATPSVRYPVRVTVYDERREMFVEGLETLRGLSGERTETLAASYLAQKLENELLEERDRREVPKDARLDAIQDYEGGVRPLPPSEPEAGVTAKMLLAAPELVNRQFAKTYLYEVLADAASEPDARVMAKVGLAALHEPVLLDLRWMLEQGELDAVQRLYVGAGLAALGDFDGAAAVYAGMKPEAQAGGGIRLSGADQDGQIRASGAALLLTSIAGHPDSDGLMRYLCGWRSGPEARALVDLELLGYLRYFRLRGEETVRFSYQAEDGKQTVDLGERGIWSAWMTRAQLEQSDMKAVDGKARARVSGTEVADQSQAGPDLDVTVEKKITPVGGSLSIGRRARVELTITFGENAPYGSYELFDWVPSGMRYQEVSRERAAENSLWLWNRIGCEGQQVSGTIWRGREDGIMPLAEEQAVASAYIRRDADRPEPEPEPDPSAGGEPNPGTDTGSEAAESPSAVQPNPGALDEPDPMAGEADTEAKEPLDGPVGARENPSTEQQNPSTEEPNPGFEVVNPGVAVENPSTDGINPGTEEPAEQGNVIRVVYYVNCVLPGEFVSEGVWLRLPDSGAIVHTARGTVTIAPEE